MEIQFYILHFYHRLKKMNCDKFLKLFKKKIYIKKI
nr:MAG TPA: hypothetical protein [Caudoviricetes sp.]